MKILNVRFKNLNSLVGEWSIDFTLPAYTADGIFAITGPTGAGKTTILDAICLAIYGRTPRLPRVTKSGNEVMSRQTGECFAEVTFETQAGRYRCHWAQHRARRKAEGELQVPRQEIANADTGEIFEIKKRGVADQIEAVTGMDFDRFTRSMMLAQGGFAAFLQAAPDERAPILEQITGTAIYSEISIRVHERQREEREALSLLKAEVAGIVPLEVEEEQAQRDELAARETQSRETAKELSRVAGEVAWLNGINALNKDIVSLEQDEKILKRELAAFLPKREQLVMAQSAATLDGQYATLSELRQQQTKDRAALEQQNQALPELQESHTRSGKTHQSAQQLLARAKSARKGAEPTLSNVRALDQRIADASERLCAAEQQYAVEESTVAALREEAPAEQRKLNALGESRLQAERYLDEQVQDQWLISNLTGLEANLLTLDAKRHEIKQSEADRASAARALEKAQLTLASIGEECAEAERGLGAVEQQFSQAGTHLEKWLGGKLLREYRVEKESLLRELGLLRQIADLAGHRVHLEDGKPCPLCGAQEHPYAEGNIPTANVTEENISALDEFIAEAELREQAVEVLRDKRQSARESLQEKNNQKLLHSNQQEAARKALDRIRTELDKNSREWNQQVTDLEARLQPLGIDSLTGIEIDVLVKQLRQRRDEWQAATDKKARIEQQEAATRAELKRLSSMIDAQGAALENKRQALDKAREELIQFRQQRTELFGSRDPDEEVAVLEASVSSAELEEQAARAACARLSEKVAAGLARAGSLLQDIEHREPRLEQLESEFKMALSASNFSGEEQFAIARMDSEQRTCLLAEAQTLDNRLTELNARMKDRQAQLAAEREKQLTADSLDSLQQRHDALNRQHQEILSATGSIKHALQKNEEAKTLLRNRQAAIDAQALECRRWGNLHALIGSSDGKKYRNFAQGLTFEMMVGHANRQLQKMSDRYLLVRDPAQPLELNVVDNYQAGEMRSTKNLSGGESFIVSLSLALGLSHMASRNVRVDSLFLDEGFGTLDEEALDTALETLSGLQQEGKLIGVISHVQALKERISTQIEVTPQTGGRSGIAGPGCARH